MFGLGNKLTSMFVKVEDKASPFLNEVIKSTPSYLDRAVKSAGWWIQQEVKSGIAAESPGGQPYPPISDIGKSRILDKMRGKKGQRPKQLQPRTRLLGRLHPATRYRFYPDSHRVVVGWISASAERLGAMHEKGHSVPVTNKMRKFFWASGVPISAKKTEIKLPVRATIRPEYVENAPKIPKYIEDKVWSYIQKGGSR